MRLIAQKICGKIGHNSRTEVGQTSSMYTKGKVQGAYLQISMHEALSMNIVNPVQYVLKDSQVVTPINSPT